LLDRPLLARYLEDCFFTLPGLPPDGARLRGQLEAVHWARGFKPRELPGMHNDLVDPAEMMRRAFHLWGQTRWPGRNGRVRYAHTLFNLYLLRQLALLVMRAWDAGPGDAGARLAQTQEVLDSLWKLGPADQPPLVRDARWLIPVAQSPGTDQLLPYFEVAEEIAASFATEDHVAIQDAVVRLAGGHLRSYLHYYVTQKGMDLDDAELVLTTRKSDALDFSLLIHGLVPLLEAYERAVQDGDGERRLALADAICQGVSPDPELFIERADLLGAYTMVEHLFAAADGDGRMSYTPLGRRHVRLLDEYEARIARLARPLHEDCRRFEPTEGAYSPYGVLFGHASGLIEHMAFKTLQPDADTRFGLEDAFTAGDAGKLAWVSGWRKLPHVDPEVAKLYEYPQRFAEALFARIERALRRRAEGAADGARRTGRLFIVPDDASQAGPQAAAAPDLPVRYVVSSDERVVTAGKAVACEPAQLASDRQEGIFVVSYETSGGWVGVTKDFLTEVLGAGQDAKIVGLPEAAAQSLRLMCRGLVGSADA
ncbi:MAG TPA: hypothetical protein VIN61_16230, partial [Gammaproteobacteria bacterium]